MYLDGMGPCARSNHNTDAMLPLSAIGSAQTLETETLRAIVRGEMRLANFKSAGVAVHARRIEATFSGLKISPLVVSAADLAEGILNLHNDPASLAEWASFILVMSELFAFAADESDYCDRLIAFTWDIAFGKPLADSAIRFATTARSRFRKA